MISTVRPTKKQRILLDFISRFIDEHGYSPSYREIMNGCNYNSIATVAVHINNLISRGHLRKRDHSARSLELTAGVTESSGGFDKLAKGDHGTDAAAIAQGVAWLLNEVEAMLQRAEQARGQKPDVSAEAQQAYNNAQVLMATLKILQIDQYGEAGDRNFTARLRALKHEMSELKDGMREMSHGSSEAIARKRVKETV